MAIEGLDQCLLIQMEQKAMLLINFYQEVEPSFSDIIHFLMRHKFGILIY
jgi:hypothetical protein